MDMKFTWYVFLTILKPLISRNARIAPSSCLQTSSKIHATNLPNLFFHHHFTYIFFPPLMYRPLVGVVMRRPWRS